MEAGDTMHQFYSDIFQRVGGVWREGGEGEEGGGEEGGEGGGEEGGEGGEGGGEEKGKERMGCSLSFLTDPERRVLAGTLLPQCCAAGGTTKPVSFTGEEVLYTQHVGRHVILCSTVISVPFPESHSQSCGSGMRLG